MPNKQKISDIVDEAAIAAQLNKLKADLNSVFEMIKSAPKLYFYYKNMEIGISDFKQKLSELITVQKEMVSQQNNLSNTQAKLSALYTDQAKRVAELNEKVQLRKKELKDEAKEALGLTGAYEQLTKKQKDLAKAEKEAGAQRILNSKAYKDNKLSAKELSDELSKLEKSTGDAHRDVGKYAEGVKEALGQASPEAEEVISKLGKIGELMVHLGPIGIAIGAGILAIGAPLAAFYKTTQDGMDRLEIKISGVKAAFSVLTGKLSEVGKSFDDAMGDDKVEETSHFWSKFLQGTLFYLNMIVPGLFFLKGKVKEIGDEMDDASNKAKKITRERIELEIEEIGLIKKRADANNALADARLKAQDENKTLKEKRDLLSKSFEIEKTTAALEIESAKNKVKIVEKNNELLKLTHKFTRENEKEYQEALANEENLETESERRRIRGARQLATIDKEIAQEEMEYRIAIAKNGETIASDSSKKILSNENSTLSQKIQAEKTSLQESLKLIDLERQAKLNQPGIDQTKINTINEEAATESYRLKSDTNERIRVLQDSYDKRDIEALKNLEKTRIDVQQDEITNKIKLDQQKYEIEIDYQSRIKLSQKNTDLELQNENNIFDATIKNSRGKTDLEIEALTEEHHRKLALITTKGELELITIQKEFYKKGIEDTKEAQTRREIELTDEYTQKLQNLFDRLQKGTLSVKQFNREKEQLNTGYEIKGIESSLSQVRQAQELAIKEKDFKSADNFAKMEADLKKQLADKNIQQYEREYERKRELRDKEIELAQQVSNAIFEFNTNRIESEKNQNELHLAQIEKNKTAEEDRINNSTLGEQQKAAELEKINQNAQMQKEQIEKKNRQLDIQKAKFEKEKSILEIIINTAAGVMKAAPDIPMMLLIGALGGIQLAVAASAPLPKYAKGRDGGKGEFALTDELGPELYHTSHGIYLGSNEPNIKYLEPNTRIVPHDQISNYLFKLLEPTPKDRAVDTKLNEFINAIYWQTGELTKVYKKQKPVIVNNRIDLGYIQYIDQQIKH